MEPFEETVARFIQANRLFEGTARILLAVSGGADSIALLHIMKALASKGILSADLICVHINHQLRGTAGADDEAFVIKQAAKLKLPCITRKIDVHGWAKTQKLSIETAGRQLRLACLTEIAQAHNCAWIATGHQQDDNAETVLQRLRRGTGFRGLAGIWPCRQLQKGLQLARPLLGCTRAEIVTYLRRQHLQWREDRSNADCAYTRNYIRHRLLPYLQSESAGPLTASLAGLAVSAQSLHTRIAREAGAAVSRHVTSTSDERAIEATALAALPEMVAVELVRSQLTGVGSGERNLTQRHYKNILALAQSDSAGKALALPGGFIARRKCDRVVLRRPAPSGCVPIPDAGVKLAIPGTTQFAGYRIETRVLPCTKPIRQEIRSDTSPFLEYLDFDRVGSALVVRGRHRGDRFVPLGLAGQKKVGKFLTAARVPEETRRQVLIFADQERILWVCPVRLSERVKITSQTRWILAVTVITMHDST